MERSIWMSLRVTACVVLFLALDGMAEDQPAFDAASIEFFEKDVRPILVARCYECHASGAKAPKGGLRMDSRSSILKGGDTGPAVSLEKPESSLLSSAINYGDVYQMPPKSKLPANEIAILLKWVERGLPWPAEVVSTAGTVKPFDLAARAAEHWCWQPLQDHVAPTVKQSQWPKTSIDRFVLSKLEAKGLSPAAPADKRTLLRRVYFDLIGLPPSPEEVERFVQDSAPLAFERVVDELLGSVHFGERWARHWMDLCRYAETRGHEFEPIIPNAWQYRDYVIRSLNADVPYDRFLTEQIAGDLIEPRWRDTANSSSLPINESLLGTGFWFLGEEVHSPVDIRKDETDRMDNRLDVLSKTFLGLTVACARCHDHKFDAISQQDYYSLAGFAISSVYRQVRVDTLEQHRKIALTLEQHRALTRRATARSVVDASTPVLKKIDRYWATAKQVIDQGGSLSESTEAGQPQNSKPSEIVNKLASDNSLDPRLLSSWCTELNLAKNDQIHPLHALFEVASADRTGADPPSAKPRKIVPTGKNVAIPGQIVNFGDTKRFPPIQDGVSFGLRPIERGELIIGGTADSPNLSVATIGGWNRDGFWNGITLSPGAEVDNGVLGAWQQYGRKVCSPEFTLSTRRAWFLIRGSVRVYADVNSHLIVMGPLHASLLKEFKHADDQWHWVAHELDQYKDHRMHFEFSPVDAAPCSIAMVVQSDEQPGMPGTNPASQPEFVAPSATFAERASSLMDAISQAARSLVENDDADTTTRQSAAPASVNQQAFPANQAELADWFVKHRQLFSLTEITIPNGSLAKLEAELAHEVRWDSSLAPAILDGNGVDEFLLVRGNSNTPKETVPRRFLEASNRHRNNTSADNALASVEGTPDLSLTTRDRDPHLATSKINFGSGRLELAQQMLRSPLSSRVAVNRIWHHLFGRGIVPSVDNFGVLGLPPSHPELLDHLATYFVNDGWSTKSLIRSLVLSQTYQMSSRPTEMESLDPDNQFWHRMPIKRLQGEAIRDSLLAISGRLDRTPFGASVPIHLTEFMQGRGRPGKSGPLDGNGRRSIYISVRRNFLSPMMLAFDTPNPFSTMGRRTVSNVPAQALIMMNDPCVIQQANLWADHELSRPTQSVDQRIDHLYVTAFARHPSRAESEEAVAFLHAQDFNNSENVRDAWRNLCHILVNLKEFMFIE